MAKPLDYNATLVKRIDLNDKLALFQVRPDKPADAVPWFRAGQYCTLGLNNEEEPDKGSVRRAMSIASAPQDAELVEFYIRFVSTPESDNPFTHLLWKAKDGDRIYMRPVAVGKFTVEDTVGTGDGRMCVMVAAGTGAAPFVSIVRDRLSQDPKYDLSKFALLHAASYPYDLGYMDYLKEVAESNGLHYLPSISRTKEVPEWDGVGGRVEDFFLPDRLAHLEEAIGMKPGEFTPASAYVLICGLTDTVGNCVRRLLPRGFIPDNRRIRTALEIPKEVPASVFYEQYDTTPPIDIKDPEVVTQLKAMLGT